MKLSPLSNKSQHKFTLISVLLFLLFGCDEKAETGSCNQFCGNTQIASVQTRATCAAMGAESKCFTKWLRKGADERDRNAWEIVYPVPVDTGGSSGTTPEPDTTPPGLPVIDLQLTADNEVVIKVSPNDPNDGVTQYEMTRNGVSCDSCMSGTTYFNPLNSIHYDRFLSELTEYCYAVFALDIWGNRSAESQSCVTTPSFSLKWSKPGVHISSNIASALDGTIYITGIDSSTGNGTLQAIDSSGVTKWTYVATGSAWLGAGGIDNVIYEDNGLIYFITKTGTFCLNSNGVLQWSNGYTGLIFNSNTGLTYSVARDEIRAINSATGITVWVYVPPLPTGVTRVSIQGYSVSISPTGILYFQLANTGTLQALKSDGTLVAGFNPAGLGKNVLSVVGSNGLIYIIADRVLIKAINPDSSLVWEYTTSEINVSISLDSSDNIYLTTYKSDSASSFIHSLTSNGVLNWVYNTQGYINAVNFESNKALYLINHFVFNSSDELGYVVNNYRFTVLDKAGTKTRAYLIDLNAPHLIIGKDGSAYIWSQSLLSFN